MKFLQTQNRRESIQREKHRRRLITIMAQCTNRASNKRWKAVNERLILLSTPQGRFADGEIRRRQARREDKRTVRFAPELSTKVRVLTKAPFDAKDTSKADVYLAESAEPYHVTEHDLNDDQHVIWNLPIQTHLKEQGLMDLSFTHKRIAVDEVEIRLKYAEHQISQRYGGDDSVGWRTVLIDAGGVEETARRAVWEEPEHPRSTVTRYEACRGRRTYLRMMLDRGIMQVIAEGTLPDTPSPAESPYLTEAHEKRIDGTCGIRRMKGLLDEDEQELLIKYDQTRQRHPGWISGSVFRMWREIHGSWSGVNYQDWRIGMTDEVRQRLKRGRRFMPMTGYGEARLPSG